MLTTDKKERKERPIFSGVLKYFPDALAEIAHVSFIGNQQHNPGQPLHWAREKSTDHGDCIARHLIDSGTIDDDGMRHSAKAAWRALALLQLEIEADKGYQATADAHGPETDAALIDGGAMKRVADGTEKPSERRRLKIAFDLDSVLNRLDDVWAEWVRKNYDPTFTVSKWTKWELDKCVLNAGVGVYDFLHFKHTFRNLPVTPGAELCLRKLHDEGHELFVVTSAIPSTWTDKVAWIKENFPFIPEKNLIASSCKGLLRVDVLVDDGLHNFNGFEGTPIIFDRPWNQGGDYEVLTRLNAYRVFTFSDLTALLKEIV